MTTPIWRRVPHYRLPARMNMYMLDQHLLLVLAALPIKHLDEARKRTQQLIRVAQIFVSPDQRLVRQHGAAETLHHCVMCSDHLRHHHAFKLIARRNALKGIKDGI